MFFREFIGYLQIVLLLQYFMASFKVVLKHFYFYTANGVAKQRIGTYSIAIGYKAFYAIVKQAGQYYFGQHGVVVACKRYYSIFHKSLDISLI